MEIKLNHNLDLLAATTLKTELLGALERSEPVTLRAEEVQRVATPFVQILSLASAAFQGANIPLTVQDPAPALKNAFCELGLERRLAELETAS